MKKAICLMIMMMIMLSSTNVTAEILVSRNVETIITADAMHFNLYIGSKKLPYRIGAKAGVKSIGEEYVVIFIKEYDKDCYPYLRVNKNMLKGLIKNYLDFSLEPVGAESKGCSKAKEILL